MPSSVATSLSLFMLCIFFKFLTFVSAPEYVNRSIKKLCPRYVAVTLKNGIVLKQGPCARLKRVKNDLMHLGHDVLEILN